MNAVCLPSNKSLILGSETCALCRAIYVCFTVFISGHQISDSSVRLKRKGLRSWTKGHHTRAKRHQLIRLQTKRPQKTSVSLRQNLIRKTADVDWCILFGLENFFHMLLQQLVKLEKLQHHTGGLFHKASLPNKSDLCLLV